MGGLGTGISGEMITLASQELQMSGPKTLPSKSNLAQELISLMSDGRWQITVIRARLGDPSQSFGLLGCQPRRCDFALAPLSALLHASRQEKKADEGEW